MSVPPDPHRTPEELLHAFLEAHPDPTPAEFEELCALHADQAEALRGLLAAHRAVDAGLPGTLTAPGRGLHRALRPASAPATSGFRVREGMTLGDFTLVRILRFYLGSLLLAAGRHAEADEVLSSLISTEESRAAWTSFEIHQITRDRALARSRMGMTEGVQQDLESSFLALRWAVGPRHREVRTAHEALLEHLDTTDRPEALRSWLDISGEPDTR